MPKSPFSTDHHRRTVCLISSRITQGVMSTPESTASSVQVRVRNIGGITETTVDFEDGVNVLTGRNATNRTSFLRALLAALGSNEAALKGDAEAGFVELTFNGETYTRNLTRQDGTTVFDGNPYLDDSEAAELFAFLLEDNEARRAVRAGDDLRELIMRPVDTERIKTAVRSLTEERDEIDTRLAHIDELSNRLPDLESQRRELRETIDETEEALAEKEAAIEEIDTSVQVASEANEQLDETLTELRAVRSDLEQTRNDIEAETRSLEALAEEREQLQDEIASFEKMEETDSEITHIEDELDQLRKHEEDLNSTLSELQSVIQYNEEMLEGTGSEVAAALGESTDHGTTDEVTDQLLSDNTVVCWTCGTSVDQTAIEETLGRLRSLRTVKRDSLNEVKSEIADLESQRRSLESEQERRTQLSSELSRIEREHERRTDRINELRSKRTDLEDHVISLEERVDELQQEDRSDLLQKHREANELEFKLGRLNDELEDIDAEIADIEEALEERDTLEAERQDLSTEIDELRTRIDRIEQDAVDRFNEHMDSVLEILDYTNLNRVWIESRSAPESEQNWFDLHIVRTTADGAAYEDTVDHLSESEREITGLIFALAGYLVHDLEETVPFLLLDSLEAIDSDRISRLIDYMKDHTDYLITALLPEDNQAVDDAYRRVTDI